MMDVKSIANNITSIEDKLILKLINEGIKKGKIEQEDIFPIETQRRYVNAFQYGYEPKYIGSDPVGDFTDIPFFTLFDQYEGKPIFSLYPLFSQTKEEGKAVFEVGYNIRWY